MGAKLWWRWTHGGQDLWMKIWEKKYKVAEKLEDKMRSQTEEKTSAIWNLAKNNKDLIRDYSFWEVREGDTAKFWEESWQEQEKLLHKEFVKEIHEFTSRTEGELVGNF